MDLYFLQYNNYYNRILKIGSDYLPDYYDYIITSITSARFNPNDGVSTVIDTSPYFEDNMLPDYCLVCEGNNIVSRWFIIEAKRIREGQYNLSLYRDLLADYYNEIVNAPIFVEKGPLPANSPLLFNQEDMTFNQIRKQPEPLYDITKCPWIIGYIPADSDLQNKTVSIAYNTANNPDIEVENIADWEFAKYLETPGYYNTTQYTGFRYAQELISVAKLGKKACSNNYIGVSRNSVDKRTDNSWYSYDDIPRNGYYNGNDNYTGTYYYIPRVPSEDDWNEYATKVKTDSQYRSYIDGYFAATYEILNKVQYEELNLLNGQTILDIASNTLYKINVKIEAVSIETSLKNEQAMISKLNSFIPSPNGGSVVNKTFTAVLEGLQVYISLDQTQTSLTVPLNNDRYHLEDQPYDMFCIPYGAIKVFELEEGFTTKLIGTSLASTIAQAAAGQGQNNIYDIQILPYCPVQYAWNDEYNYIDLTKTKYSIIRDQDNKKVSTIIWCRNSNFNFNINCHIPDTSLAVEKKIKSQTETYRLVSPNYGSIFEFNPYKNGGVELLRVDCSYKPFNPYVRIAPIFKNLYGYGGQYDARGLILSGDFSITQLSNAWATYELQNKNYQAIFDRQIENLEVQNKYQKINEIVGGIVGTVQGGMYGATAGAMMGGAAGPYGAAIGAAVGGTAGTIASAAGGITDYFVNEALRKETLDFTKDQFGYQLGNIQALPSALAKTTVLNINNSLVPMLERYDCTETEKNAFKNKIQYNGMTVMTVGTMAEYIGQKNFDLDYFKGKLIRLEGLMDDAHIITMIANELNKGVYI